MTEPSLSLRDKPETTAARDWVTMLAKYREPDQLRSFAAELLQKVEVQDRTIRHQQAVGGELVLYQ